MESSRNPKQLLDYQLVERRPRRSLKKLLDGCNREAEVGHLLASLRYQKKKVL
jgi:hypothetical protein